MRWKKYENLAILRKRLKKYEILAEAWQSIYIIIVHSTKTGKFLNFPLFFEAEYLILNPIRPTT